MNGTESEEIWAQVERWPEYEVSNLGRVRRGGRFIAPYNDGTGYLSVNLCRGGHLARRRVHRLVCAAFHGPAPSPKHDAAHWDGTRTNNVASNIRWATRSENLRDKSRHGRAASNLRKLSPESVTAIRRALRDGKKRVGLAKEFQVTSRAIYDIARGRTWAWLKEEIEA